MSDREWREVALRTAYQVRPDLHIFVALLIFQQGLVSNGAHEMERIRLGIMEEKVILRAVSVFHVFTTCLNGNSVVFHLYRKPGIALNTCVVSSSHSSLSFW